MKRSFFALAALTMMAGAVLFDVAARTCVAVYRHAEAAFKATVFGPPLQAPVEADVPDSPPVVALRRADNFVLRLLKRERPVITPEWRMVPST